jgi:hypothetical protein
MNRKHAARIAIGGTGVCAVAGVAHLLGVIPFWVYTAVLVLSFPAIVISLYLWWMAREGKEDIPFIGY